MEDVKTAARAAGVELDETADFTMPPPASKPTPAQMYVKLLVEQQVLAGMTGEEQQVCLHVTQFTLEF